MDKFGKFFRTYSIVAVLAFVFIFFSITTDAFLTPANILNIIRAVSMVGLICCGYSLVMISGGVDISTGWIMCLSMVMMTRAMVVWHWPTWISVLLDQLYHRHQSQYQLIFSYPGDNVCLPRYRVSYYRSQNNDRPARGV